MTIIGHRGLQSGINKISNGFLIQWVVLRGTSPNAVIVNFPITFNNLIGSNTITSSLLPGGFNIQALNLAQASGLYYRTDGNYSYTLGGIFIGN